LLETALLYRIATADIDTSSPVGTKLSNEFAAMFGLCSNGSNSMKSDNPESGIYLANTTRTLDSHGGNPNCNQGGMIVVEKEAKAIHESISGYNVNISDTAYALRSGRKPLLLEGITYEAAGFDAIQITSKHNRSSVKFENPYPTLCKDSHPHVITLHPEIVPTLTASAGGTSRPGGGQGNELDYYMAYSLQGNMIGRADHNGPQGEGINENSCFTLNATDQHAVAFFNFNNTNIRTSPGDIASTQTARQHKSATDLIVHKVSVNANTGFARYVEGAYGTLTHSGGDLGGGSESLMVVPCYIVRRLTPTECERLQGFPDDWTKYGTDSDKQIADTPRYQMLGNSIAIPVVRFILNNIVRLTT